MDDAISITVYDFSLQQFMNELSAINNKVNAYSKAEMPVQKTHGFTIDPQAATILVTGVNSLVLLINAILVFLSNRQTGTVRIVSASGQSLEFPRGTSPEKLNEYIELAKKLDIKQIIITAKS